MSSRKIKLLHMIETTGQGGAETVLLNIVREINPDEFTSIVTVPGEGWLFDHLRAAGIDTRIVPSTRANDLSFLLKIRRLVKSERIDLIHSHLDGMNFYACLAGRMSGCPVIPTFHGMVGDWHSLSLKNRTKFAVIRRYARQVMAVSNYLKQELEHKWHFPPELVTRIYNGVDFGALDAANSARSLRDELGLARGTPLVGMVGNIRKPKGYRYYVTAAHMVAERMPSCRFIIAGQGEGQLLRELLGQIEALGMNEHIRFIGFREDVANVLKSFDLFVLSSLTEGLSIATIEALGLGKPVVVTDSGGPAEIVRNGETGFLVPPADPGALAEKIMHLLQNRGLAERMGQAGKVDVRRRFSLEQSVRAYEQLYRDVMK